MVSRIGMACKGHTGLSDLGQSHPPEHGSSPTILDLWPVLSTCCPAAVLGAAGNGLVGGDRGL